jgi:hypothetical protein
MLTIKSFEWHRASKDRRDNGPAAPLKHLLNMAQILSAEGENRIKAWAEAEAQEWFL